MHPFPLIEALWASLDQERPSGDDPVRVASALHRFYGDFHRGFLEGRKNRWKTKLFHRNAPLVEDGLKAAIEVTRQLSETLSNDRNPPALAELRRLDQSIRTLVFELDQEERGFGLPSLPSPQLMQMNYLFEGWARSLLPPDPLGQFLADSLKSVGQTRQEIQRAGDTASERESSEETQAVEEASRELESLYQALNSLASKLESDPASCNPVRDSILEHGHKLHRAFLQLEQCAPLSEPCPFCSGELSLSGRCRTCGRRLPHLEEGPAGEETAQPIESNFRANNLRAVDLAVLHWEAAPNENLWKDLQAAVRRFGQQVTQGQKKVAMLAGSPDRPVSSDSPDRLREAELIEIGKAFNEGQKLLSNFAFQPFPPKQGLAENWRESLYQAEARLQALERKLEASSSPN